MNVHGIRPEENDDAPRNVFCDVRFDTGDSAAVPTHCLWSGKIYCPTCAGHLGPLPEFVLPPDSESAGMFTLSYDSVYYRANTPSGRIQPVSKKQPEVPRVKIAPLPEEPDDPPDPFEIVGDWLKENVPVCGKPMKKQVDSLKKMLDSLND